MNRFGEAAQEAAALGGAALVSYGAWLAYHPAGFVAAGAFLLAAGWLSARRGAR